MDQYWSICRIQSRDNTRFITNVFEWPSVLLFVPKAENKIENLSIDFWSVTRSIILAKLCHIRDQRHRNHHMLTFATIGQKWYKVHHFRSISDQSIGNSGKLHDIRLSSPSSNKPNCEVSHRIASKPSASCLHITNIPYTQGNTLFFIELPWSNHWSQNSDHLLGPTRDDFVSS